MPTLLVLEPHLSQPGHWQPTVREIARQASNHGWRALALTTRGERPVPSMEPLEVLPWFREPPPGVLWPADGSRPEAEQVRAVNARFESQLLELPADVLADARLVILPSTTIWNVLGTARWLAARLPVPSVLQLLAPDFVQPERRRTDERVAWYREATDLLRGDPRTQPRLWVESTQLLALLRRHLDRRVLLEDAPQLTDQAALRRAWTERSGRERTPGPMRIVKLGRLHEVTGLRSLHQVVRRVVEHLGGRVQFLVQCAPYAFQNALPEHAEPLALTRALAELPQVTVVTEPLSAPAWYGALAEADFVLLPYASGVRYQGSGVFREALALGAVPVLPRGSELDAAARRQRMAVVRFRPDSTSSMVRAVLRAVRAHARLARKAQRAAPRWQAHHDPDARLAALLR